ncbi:MAG: universal stress protein, partial [Anaerolineae bacterium]|nr:universal stress protein [Anaerolineae bacterium]
GLMERFKNILVVIDEKTENRAVVERAVILAQRNQASLTIVNTVGTLPRQVTQQDIPEPPVDIDIIEEWPPDEERPPAPEPPLALSERPHEAQVPNAEPLVVIREHI